jgi:glycosyltransferase involved in cell wall biosynthesis
MEAMLCGTAVIGSNVGGIPDMIVDGETGLLAKAADASELAQALEWMINHPEERETMGDSARKLIEKECSLEVQSGRYISLYESILKNK